MRMYLFTHVCICTPVYCLKDTPGSAERVIRTEAGSNHAFVSCVNILKSWEEIMRACS